MLETCVIQMLPSESPELHRTEFRIHSPYFKDSVASVLLGVSPLVRREHGVIAQLYGLIPSHN